VIRKASKKMIIYKIYLNQATLTVM